MPISIIVAANNQHFQKYVTAFAHTKVCEVPCEYVTTTVYVVEDMPSELLEEYVSNNFSVYHSYVNADTLQAITNEFGEQAVLDFVSSTSKSFDLTLWWSRRTGRVNSNVYNDINIVGDMGFDYIVRFSNGRNPQLEEMIKSGVFNNHPLADKYQKLIDMYVSYYKIEELLEFTTRGEYTGKFGYIETIINMNGTSPGYVDFDNPPIQGNIAKAYVVVTDENRDFCEKYLIKNAILLESADYGDVYKVHYIPVREYLVYLYNRCDFFVRSKVNSCLLTQYFKSIGYENIPSDMLPSLGLSDSFAFFYSQNTKKQLPDFDKIFTETHGRDEYTLGTLSLYYSKFTDGRSMVIEEMVRELGINETDNPYLLIYFWTHNMYNEIGIDETNNPNTIRDYVCELIVYHDNRDVE